MPSCFEVWMIEGIWNVFPSRIRFEMAGVVSRISRAATRPPPTFLHSVCAITPFSDSDNITRICDCRSAGNWSIMRSTVDAAVVVCRVPNTRWPVSAVSIAIAMVSRSRISPTSTMSGSPQGRSQRPLEAVGVHTHLPLGDDALLVLMYELDRVLDRDDVVRAGAVDQVDQRAQGGGFPRAGRSGDEHETLR